MPLTIGLGTLAAVMLLPHLAIWEAAIIGTVLAPMDAALGQVVVATRGSSCASDRRSALKPGSMTASPSRFSPSF